MSDKKNDNKKYVITSLKELERKNKKKEIKWLTDPSICATIIPNPLKDKNKKTSAILVMYISEETRISLRENNSGKDRYYAKPITLFGIPYLVFNHWTKINMTSFKDWIQKTLEEDSL